MTFLERYGSWGIVAGASAGLGAEYARQLAGRGLNLVLVARRLDLLTSLSAELTSKYGIRTKCLELDLSDVEAAEQIVWQSMDLDVGLLVYNASYSAVGPFLEQSMDAHMQEIHTNVHSPLKLVYLLAQRFVPRRSGGVILMSSLSGFQGSAYISTYAAAKAFNIVLAEGLWEEWRTHGVDVLVCVSGMVKTKNLVASRPQEAGDLEDMSMEPAQVVHEALKALGKQPCVVPGLMNRIASFVMRHLLPRKVAVKIMGRTLRKMYIK